ncbi:MAG TPA: PLP-dependent aminotransferase family protein [Rhodocyclaceae bacterium]|nr:PLP-dependent aminotransferase family protein [Rhodocyclaceae bacterium]
MELHVVIHGKKDLSGQLYRQLREAILSGRLKAGEQLPPTRLLAEQLGFSRKTVTEAYARLSYDNLLIGQAGTGTFINANIKTRAQQRKSEDLAGSAVVEHWRNIGPMLAHPVAGNLARYDFIGGATPKNLFPNEEWRRCMLHGLRQNAAMRGLYAPIEGLPPLREAIARHISFSRGVRCTADDVIITNGAQQALDLISRVLVVSGNVVAIEEPGYPPARQLMTAQGAQVVGVPVDAEGIIVEQIPDTARLIYVTPAHQFPLGMPMSEVRRRALLAKARDIGAIIMEDDYDSEFRYSGRPTDSLQSMDEDGIVAFVGTFSKTLSPELRIGYLIAPPALLNAVATAKKLSDSHTALTNQWALLKFIDDGLLLKHIRRCHSVYASRREKIEQRFADDLAPWFELIPATAGFHLAARCRREIDIQLLIALAHRAEVGLYPLSFFYHYSEPQHGLLFGYGAIETLDIGPALDRVRDILTQIT